MNLGMEGYCVLKNNWLQAQEFKAHYTNNEEVKAFRFYLKTT